MTTLYLFGGYLGLLVFVALGVWAYGATREKLGATKAIADERAREKVISDKQAAIIAEHREPEDAAKALDGGRF